ncbi:Flp pilus assembly protein CpaB [Sphingomonas sp. SORGH_AS_0879]|uniref:Flp pilus assembly protein CpaB n=1 Tax=Sphingomonas sp. SORGH_AS_0879 TaxID=3041790 RepID=UPI00277DD11D|nr:Flp pilus assembly protein CpaB [Sphingomonas sp. SORGH_AS_0879]MDQ1229942.1 pilus assembly protein CpaB [Sphingomonas sp. SORGH_AS_0879]
MDSRKVLLLVGALLIAGVTALFARAITSGNSAPPAEAAVIPAPAVPQAEVLVATRTLPVGTIIDTTALKFQPWPKDMVAGAYYVKGQADVAKLQGTVLRYAITAGQPLTQGAVVRPGDRGFLAAALTPGMRAVTVPVSAQTAVAGFVFPGDRIDMVLTQDVAGGGDGPPLKVSETILRNVRVLATDQRTDNQAGDDGKTPVHTFTTVTVEATPKMAEQLAVAQTVGTLSLSLRALAERPDEMADGRSDAIAQPVIDRASFATGGDVSRYQRRTVPGLQSNAAPNQGGMLGAPSAAPAAGVQTVAQNAGVRVMRGSSSGTSGDASNAGKN